MSNYPIAVQAFSTITVGASGSADQQVSTAIISSNCPFSDVTLTVRPLENSAPYRVDVYQDGEVVETHSYPDASNRVVAHLTYPGVIFPANLGTSSIPKYFGAARSSPSGLSFFIEITNLSSEQRTFEVYATYLTYQTAQYRKVTS
jgi:hypothetical protein